MKSLLIYHIWELDNGLLTLILTLSSSVLMPSERMRKVKTDLDPFGISRLRSERALRG